MSIRRCENCEFYERDHTYPEQGECHLKPPIRTKWGWSWPYVRFNNWCGEFSPKVKENPQSQPNYITINGNDLILDPDGDIGQ